MAKIDFGGTKENIVTRAEFPLKKAQQVLKDEVVAVIGYGVQGPAQSLNMRDNGINVIIGQDPRFAGDWKRAALGAEPALDHPRQALEPFFLDVVATAARATAAPVAGAEPAAPLAPFLRG